MKEQVYRSTEDFLAAVQTPNHTRVGMQDDGLADLISEDMGPGSTARPYVTGVVGPILPITFKLWDQIRNETISFDVMVNPESFNHGKTNSTQATYTRRGFVTQLWGPNQDTISATGKTAGFMSPGAGMDNVSHRRSLAFHNLMALMATYRNNGYQYAPGTTNKDFSRVIDVVRGVEMLFDGNHFMGHFNNFTLDYAADSPNLMSLSFEFTISQLNHANWSDVRGHFIPIGWTQQQIRQAAQPKLLADLPNDITLALGAAAEVSNGS